MYTFTHTHLYCYTLQVYCLGKLVLVSHMQSVRLFGQLNICARRDWAHTWLLYTYMYIYVCMNIHNSQCFVDFRLLFVKQLCCVNFRPRRPYYYSPYWVFFILWDKRPTKTECEVSMKYEEVWGFNECVSGPEKEESFLDDLRNGITFCMSDIHWKKRCSNIVVLL